MMTHEKFCKTALFFTIIGFCSACYDYTAHENGWVKTSESYSPNTTQFGIWINFGCICLFLFLMMSYDKKEYKKSQSAGPTLIGHLLLMILIFFTFIGCCAHFAAIYAVATWIEPREYVTAAIIVGVAAVAIKFLTQHVIELLSFVLVLEKIAGGKMKDDDDSEYEELEEFDRR